MGPDARYFFRPVPQQTKDEIGSIRTKQVDLAGLAWEAGIG